MQPTKPVLITSAQRLRDLRRDSMNLLTQKQRSAAFHAFLGELAHRLEDKKTVRRSELVDELELSFRWAKNCVPANDKPGAVLVREKVIPSASTPGALITSEQVQEICQKLESENVSGCDSAMEEARKVFARTNVPLGIPKPSIFRRLIKFWSV